MNVTGVIAQIPKMNAKDRAAVRQRAEQWADASDEAKRVAGREVLEALTRQAVEEHSALYERLNGLDATQKVIEAFTAVPMTDTDRTVIQALLDHPGSDSSTLSVACGWKPGTGWHMHFGKMCAKRGSYLWPAPYAAERDADFYCGILCDWDWSTGPLTYTLKPEVAAAFATMGLRATSRCPIAKDGESIAPPLPQN